MPDALPRCRDCGFAPEFQVDDPRGGYICRDGSKTVPKEQLRRIRPEDFGLPPRSRERRMLASER